MLHTPLLTIDDLMDAGVYQGLQYLSLKNAEIIDSYGDMGNPQDFPEALKNALKVRIQLSLLKLIHHMLNIHYQYVECAYK